MFDKISPSCQIPNLNAFYERYFPDNSHGIFIEVGGNDGYTWSNTWGLAEIGWRGWYYEPDPHWVDVCRVIHARNNIKVIQTCVGAYNGEIKLYRGYGATTSKKVAETDIFKHSNRIVDFEWSPVCKLEDSLFSECVPFKFDLLVIDVNGDEPGVLMGLNLEIWKPTMIIVATHKAHDGWDFNAPIIDGLLSGWYEEIWHDHINSIYVRK